jgi:hypothetical protein
MGMPLQRMTLAEFMVWENQQQDRHEFYRGEWFNMVGGTRGHNRVVNNLVFRLNIHLDNSPWPMTPSCIRTCWSPATSSSRPMNW